jgi:radical SAM superfamily enzyme YgiQ (UPF0313 family)
MCLEEVMERVDSVVTGEAEGIWSQVLEDARNGSLKRRYDGGLAEISDVPIARHDLLATGYACGAIQTTRGCPLNCSFCSVTAFNGAHYRQRPIPDVVREFHLIREKHVLVVDDNLIGTRHEHIARALMGRPAWKAIEEHYQKIRNVYLGSLFADDPRRGERFAAEGAGIYLDYSKNHIADETIGLLLNLAEERGLRERIWAMFRGQKINITENGWFAARPSGTEDVYKIYAESFPGSDHLRGILEEAQAIVNDALAATPQRD